jgi:hypothetical protein
MDWQNKLGWLCLALAVLTGVAGFAMLGPRLLEDVVTQGWSLLPFLSAALACAAAMLVLRSQASTTAAPSDTTDHADFRAAIEDMRALLNDERRQWTELREASSATARESMVVGAHLAGFAMDAEKRLSETVEQAELRLLNTVATLEGAVTIADRFEQIASEAEARGIAQSYPQEGGAATFRPLQALTAAADAAAHALERAASGTVARIAAMGDASNRMERDAASLDQACREIAAAGAGVVARAHEAVGRVETVLAGLPDLAAAITTQTDHAVQALDDAALALQQSTQVQAGLHEAVINGSADLQARVHDLTQAGHDHAGMIASASAGLLAHAEALPALAVQLGTGAQALEAAAAEIATATHAGTAASQALLAGIGQIEAAARAVEAESGLAREAAGACLAAGEAVGSDIGRATDALLAAIHTLATTAEAGVRALNDEAQQLCAATAQMVASASASAGMIRGEVDRIDRKVAEMSGAGGELAASIASLRGSIDTACTSGNATMGALLDALSHRTDHMQATLRDAGDQLAQLGAEAAASLRDHAGFVSGRLAEAGANLRGDADVLSARAQEIDRMLAAVQQRVSLFSEAGLSTGQRLDNLAGEFRAEANERLREIAGMIGGIAPMLHRFETLAYDMQAPAAPAATEALLHELAGTCARIEGSLAALHASAEQLTEADEAAAIEWRNSLAEQVAVLARLQGDMAATAGALSQGLGHVAQTCSGMERSETLLTGAIGQVRHAAEQVMESARACSEAASAPPHPAPAADPLARLAGVGVDAAALMHASTTLAEAAISGRPGLAEDWITGRAPEILSAVDTAIRQLQSVATAVAIASDAGGCPPRRSQAA